MIVAKRRLSTVDHACDVVGMTYVYPVVSRRAGGVSVGINLNPNNACNWRCVYCQVANLVLAAGPAIDLARLEEELRALLDDIVHGDFLARSAPEGSRELKDIAFAGNGEPTTSPDFPAALEVVARVLETFELRGKIPVYLITNGSQVKKPEIAAALKRLATLNGEVWIKLDTATADGMRRINQFTGDAAAQIAKVRAAAPLCPTWIQSCFFVWEGELPTASEQAAYIEALRQLVRHRVPVRGVLLYTVARPSMQPEALRVTPLSEEWLRAFAARIEDVGLTCKVSM